MPAIKGIEHACYAVDLYKDLSKLGKSGTHRRRRHRCESGYFFADQCGTQIHILEMRDDICKDSNDSQRRALIPRMKKAGMTWDCNACVLEITEKGVRYKAICEGKEQFAETDCVIYACGSRADSAEVDALKGIVPWYVALVMHGRHAR